MGSGTFTNSHASATNCLVVNCIITTGGDNCGGLMGYGADTYYSQATATDCVVANCIITTGGDKCGGLMGFGAYSYSQATATG